MSLRARIRALHVVASDFVGQLATFRRSTRANVAMMFGLSLVPITVSAGAGLDLARGMLVHSQMMAALDAASLAVGGTPGLSQAQMLALAQTYFNANYHLDSSFGTPTPLTMTQTGQQIQVTTTTAMPTTLMAAIGYSTFNVNAASTVVWGQQKLWVSLVLDNTGSMTQTDNNGLSKISALKTATHSLLSLLQQAAASAPAGSVQVSITPFARDVKIGTSYSTATWLSWTDWLAAPTPAPSTSIGPGSNCPYTDASNTFHCQTTPTNGSTSTTRIPSSGTYSGYICPSGNTVGHYYNGCWTSTSAGSGRYNHSWVTNAKSTWGGCVTDRTQDYDVNVTTPTTSTPATLMVAENSPSCVTAALMGLSYNWTTLSNEVDAMVANGSTNQTIGLAWGWQSQVQGVPLSAPVLPPNTEQVIILLSDGLNTQDRWYGDGSNESTGVDNRMAAACTNAKAAGIVVYTVFVDLNGTQGNSSVLQNCATDLSKYYDLTNASQIISTFQAIGQQITNLRISG
jgi:Flp pilus assembly protein TadG